MERIKNSWRNLLLALLWWGSSMNLFAQTQSVSSDSISIIDLIEMVETATSYKIYTNISKPFMVEKQKGTPSLSILKEVLKGTLSTAKSAIECYFKEGMAVAQNKFN